MEGRSSARVSLEEYLRIDAASPERLEFRGGYVVAFAVPSGNHEQIKANLAGRLASSARARGCKPLLGGVKVICPNGDRNIPDLGMTCDERDRRALDAAGEAVVEHPWLIIEILSPATAADDRTEKLDAYREIPELTHYLVIDSRKQWMLLHSRTSDGRLAIESTIESVELPGIGELDFATIYDGTSVPKIVLPT
jgi:Uma2 family endonuclease